MPQIVTTPTTYSLGNKNESETNSLAFPEYLRNWHSFIKREQMKTRKLTEMSVEMHRRDRGLTISDQYGGYGTRPTTEGRWMDYRPDEDGEIYPINIVSPAIATNKSACLQSNSETLVASANESAQHKQIAMRWQKVCDFFERTGWDESKRTFIFDATQKDGTILVRALIKKADSQSVPSVNEQKSGLAVYKCKDCGAQGMTETNEPDESMTEIECPQCGGQASAMVKALAGFDLDEQEVSTFDINDELIPFYNFTIDSYGAKIGGIQTARFLQVQRLRDRPFMESQHPNYAFAGGSQWCYQLRCDFALATADWGWLNGWSRTSGFSDFDRIQEDSVYLHEDAYSNYRTPADFQFVNSDGNLTFKIKRGQTIAEAQEALYGENQHGFMFVWSDEYLLNIPSPETEALNFRECFSDVHWSRGSGSYHSSPNYSIKTIQDTITLVNTLKMTVIARNAVNPVYYNSLVFDNSDFSKEYIGTSKANLLPDADMSKSVFSLPVPTPSPYLDSQLQFLFEIKDGVSQVTPAMRGEAQKGTPYAAQRQQLEQSWGNLTPVLKSFAQCKVDTFLNKAKLAKKHWTLEQFQRVASMFGEIWSDEDIEEMCEIDFNIDLFVSYRAGSEIPSTQVSREMKFFAALQQLGTLPPEILMQMVTPDRWAMIIERAGELGELGFDISDREVDDMVEQKRYIDLATLCKPFQDWSFDAVQNARNHVVSQMPPAPAVLEQAKSVVAQAQQGDPQALEQAKQMLKPIPVTSLDLITEKIFHDSHIVFSQYEDLAQQKTFFIEMLKSEQGKAKPNYILLEMLNVLLGSLDQAMDAMQKDQLAKDPQVQAGAAADAAAKADRQAEIQLDAAKLESAHQIKQQQIDLKVTDQKIKAQQADRDAMLGLMTHASEQDHDATMNQEVPPRPKETIIETIKYETLPPVAQQELLKEVGIDVSVADLKQTVKDNNPTPKPTAPTKKQ